METVYTGLSVYGKFISVVSGVVIVLLSGFVASLGWYGLHDPHTKIQQGIVIGVQQASSSNTFYHKITVQYEIDGLVYTTSVVSSDPVKVGDKINVFYNPLHPNDIEITKLTTRSSYVLLGLSGIGVLAAVFFVYLSFQYKEFAALQGGLGVFDFLRG